MLRIPRQPGKILLFILIALPLFLGGHTLLPSDGAEPATRFTETEPPAGPVRPIAEFEPASHVLIRYPLGIPLSLVTHLANTAQVICLVSSTGVQNSATTAFTNAGVNMANVSFLIAATDSYWTRDYGPWFIFDANGDYGVVDFVYNRPRPNDNLIPQIFAQQNNLDYYGMNLQQTGGNYMTDGINTAGQTMIAYTENSGYTHAQIDAKMQAYLGITNYQVLPDPNNTYIDHIDCWSKFLAPDKVLVRSVPTSHAQYDEIEAAAAHFANLNCAWGYPYKVYRVNTPQNQPYTNSLILNKRVFVPTMSSSYDAAALQAYRDALPGYEVIGVPGGSAVWESTDALHCRAHEIPDKNMLHISHQPHWGGSPYVPSTVFTATITPHSGQPVYADSVFVSYRLNQGPWQRAILTPAGGNEYSVQINNYAPGDTIRYFIHAADQSGRSTDHPFTAALDPHVFVMTADLQAPEIAHTPLAGVGPEPTLFLATVTDASGVGGAELQYKIDAGETLSAPMELWPGAGENVWYCVVTPQYGAGPHDFFYRISAWDLNQPPNTASYPAGGEWLSVPCAPVPVSDLVVPSPEPSALNVYPNPFRQSASSPLTVDYKDVSHSISLLKVFNIKGQLVYTQKIKAGTSGTGKLLLSSAGKEEFILQPGVYLFQLTTTDKTLSRKLLVLP